MPTGPELIRAGIERDRGGRSAPGTPVRFICRDDGGVPDASEPLHQTPPRRSLRDRTLGAVANAILCPGCLSLRFGPGHLTRRLLFGIDCRNV